MDPSQVFRVENLPDLRSQIKILDTKHYVSFGGFGEVRRGYLYDCSDDHQNRGPPLLVAVKAFRGVQLAHVPDEQQTTYERRHMRELRVWQGLRHRNILPLLGRYTNDDFARFGGLVSPYRELGDVKEFLAKNPAANRLSIIQGAATGLAYLHSYNVIHGDLKPRNILMNFDGREYYPEICDFGISRVLGRESDISKTFVGVYRYMAPEIVLNEEIEGTKVLSFQGDIYAMGMVILEVITGVRPFNDKINDAAVILALSKRYRPHRQQYARNIPLLNECWPIIQSCWKENPHERCNSIDIVNSLQRLQWPIPIVPVARQ